MKTVSKKKCLLASRLSQYLSLLSVLLTPPLPWAPWASLLPAPLSYRTLPLGHAPHLFSGSLLPFSPLSSSLALLSRHSAVCWSCSVCYFLSLFWILLDVSSRTLPHIYSKYLLTCQAWDLQGKNQYHNCESNLKQALRKYWPGWSGPLPRIPAQWPQDTCCKRYLRINT